MKGFIVWMIPTDPSGIERNKAFVKSNSGKLIGGGKATIKEDGRLKCEWAFENKFPMPDSMKKMMLERFTASLDDAIKEKANVRYEVELVK